MSPSNGRRTASVVWELSEDEGMVVVDVDAPLRPFGSITPPRGTKLEARDTLPDEDVVAETPTVPKPSRLFADDPMASAWDEEWGEEKSPSDGMRRTLPPIPRG